MRSFILTFFIICSVAVSGIKAQGIFDAGLKAGYTSNRIATSIPAIEEELTDSFHAGVFTRFNIKRVFIQPEAYFINKGGILIEDPLGDGNVITNELNFETLDIPLLFGLKIINGEKINLRIMAGPCTSFVLNKDFTLSETFAEVSRYHFEDALFSLQAGVGLDIFMFTLDLRTEAGLSDLSPSSSFDMHHKTINLSLGFKFI